MEEVSYIREGKGRSIPKENHCKENPKMAQRHSGRRMGKFSCTADIILTLVVLVIGLIFMEGYNLGKIVGAETQTEEYLDGRLEQ